MIEFFEKLRKVKIGKRNVGLIAVCVMMLAVILLSEVFTEESEVTASTDDTALYSAQYIESTEKELEAILSKINGAGKVKVMITLESCYENVYAVGENSSVEQDGDSYQSETQEDYIIIKNGSSTEECLIVKVYQPVVKGVAVVAEGAGNASVKNALTQAVCALFDISSTKVSVEKMTND